MKHSKKTRINVFHLIGRILFCFFAALLVFVFVLAIVSRVQGFLGVGNFEARMVLTGSMEPTISAGSLVIFDKGITKEELQVGDIIIFHYAPYGDVPITHRIIDIVKNGDTIQYICKGDASSGLQTISSGDVIGKITFTSMFLGNLLTFIQTPSVLIIGSLVLIAVTIIIFFLPEDNIECLEEGLSAKDEELERLKQRLEQLSHSEK